MGGFSKVVKTVAIHFCGQVVVGMQVRFCDEHEKTGHKTLLESSIADSVEKCFVRAGGKMDERKSPYKETETKFFVNGKEVSGKDNVKDHAPESNAVDIQVRKTKLQIPPPLSQSVEFHGLVRKLGGNPLNLPLINQAGQNVVLPLAKGEAV